MRQENDVRDDGKGEDESPVVEERADEEQCNDDGRDAGRDDGVRSLHAAQPKKKADQKKRREPCAEAARAEP